MDPLPFSRPKQPPPSNSVPGINNSFNHFNYQVGKKILMVMCREASQIFGGLAYTRGGQAEKVERIYREVRAYAIPAGSEEIMVLFFLLLFI